VGTGHIDYKAGGGSAILPAYVPDFQRDYAWTSTVGSKLLQDLIYNTYPQSLVPNPGGVSIGDYHLGHLLSFDQNQVTADPIVDGQQRLFTLSVISCHLRNKALQLGFHKLAWEIDNMFIWGAGRYGDAEMLFKPKNCDYLESQKMNPFKVLLNLCEIEHTFEVRVAADQTQGGNVSITIDPIEIPWMLRERVKINFDNGSVFEISNSINQGTRITSISGGLTQEDVAIGEIGTVFLGQKSGETPIVSSLMGRAISNLREKVDEFIENGGAGVPHLNTAEERCTELKYSLQSVNFDMTSFSSEGAAIRHFEITNSESHKITLSAYDLLRAKILRIRDAAPVTGYQIQGNIDYELFKQWRSVRSLIEKKYPKNKPKEKFFQRYLQAKGLSHSDVNSEFMAIINPNFNQITRQWNKQPVTQFLGDLFKFLKWHEEIWNKPDALAAAYYEEEFYLLLQTKVSFTQWIPLYLAAKNKFNNQNSQTSLVDLLKYVTEFFGKGSILNNLNNGFPSVEPNQFWGEVPGWIETINRLGDNPTDAEVTIILNSIKTDIDTLLQPITWTLANITTDPDGNTRKFKHDKNTNLRYLLCLIEKEMGGIEDGNGRYKNGMSACDVEHVLAKKLDFGDKSPDYIFTNLDFEDSKHRLGNRLLLTSKANKHIKQISFALKMTYPRCAVGNDCNGVLHYDQNVGQWKLIDEFLNKYLAGGTWDAGKIDDWELELLTRYQGLWP